MGTRLRTTALWVITVLMAVMMVGPGVQKFTGSAWQRMFRVWGYPDHFYLVVGAVEVIGGLALLVPRLAPAAGLTLMVVMAAASATRFTHGASGAGDLVFAALLATIAYCRWPGVFVRRAV
jgi:putative oxidoreductase